MSTIEKLTALFERFPGIGPRQAARFVHFLLRSSPSVRRELIEEIRKLEQNIHQCASCMRFFDGKGEECNTCANERRNGELLMIVATDADRVAIESSGQFVGHYFILGGLLALGNNKKSPYLYEKQLKDVLARKQKEDLSEVILAFPANPEGDATVHYVQEKLQGWFPKHALKVTTLGRGLSTGSEIEYADPETIKNALSGRA